MVNVLRHSKSNQNVQENLTASFTNIAAHKSNLPLLLSNVVCKLIVSLAKKGCGAVKAQAALFIRHTDCTLEQTLVERFVNVDVIAVLVRLLSEGASMPGGAAEFSAGAIARIVSCDKEFATIFVKQHGIEGLLNLLTSGTDAAKVQAAKSLVVLAQYQDFCKIICQQGGKRVVYGVLETAQNEVAKLSGLLIELILAENEQAEKPTTIIERQLNAKLAVLNYKAEDMRNRAMASRSTHLNASSELEPIHPTIRSFQQNTSVQQLQPFSGQSSPNNDHLHLPTIRKSDQKLDKINGTRTTINKIARKVTFGSAFNNGL
jgi:hypothetical protein